MARHAVETRIIGQANCQRCNAVAKLVARRFSRTSDAYEVRGECPKCKYVGVLELTSVSQLRRMDRHAELMSQYKTATPAQKGRIMREVQAMAKEESDWLSSL